MSVSDEVRIDVVVFNEPENMRVWDIVLNVGDVLLCKSWLREHDNVEPVKDILDPLEFVIVTDCNLFEASDATNLEIVNPVSVILAKLGVPEVDKSCKFADVSVNVDPVKDSELFEPFELLFAIVTDCNCLDALDAVNCDAVNPVSVILAKLGAPVVARFWILEPTNVKVLPEKLTTD